MYRNTSDWGRHPSDIRPRSCITETSECEDNLIAIDFDLTSTATDQAIVAGTGANRS